nr:MAG TPA: hypothetical protein [Caudoviricetes sp.]
MVLSRWYLITFSILIILLYRRDVNTLSEFFSYFFCFL